MSWNRRSPSAVALSVLLCSLVATAPAAQMPTDSEPDSDQALALAPYVDGLAEALLSDHDIPGLTVAVVLGDGPDLIRGYGHADLATGRPVDGHDTVFRIGSVSKTFTWTAVMMLVERGLLDLDADVNDYLKRVRVADAFDAPVTMAHLMAHRAGFEDTLAVFTATDDDPRSLSELLTAHQPKRVFPPGARTIYSNWGAALAAQVVEDVSGLPYEVFLLQEILQPLAMTSTTLRASPQMPVGLRARMAIGYRFEQGDHVAGVPMQIGAYAPAGAMASTAADMARWLRFHLNGGELNGVRLLSPETHARMRQRAFTDRPAAADVAHGFQSLPYRGIDTLGHSGSTGLFRSRMLLAPELGLGLFAAQNIGQGGYRALSVLSERLLQRVAGPPAPTAFAAPTGNAEYAGTYRNNRRSFSALPALFAIPESIRIRADENGLLVSGGESPPRRYRPVAGLSDLFERADGDRLMFQRDPSGRIVAVNDGSGVHSHERSTIRDASTTAVAALAAVVLLALSTLLGAAWRWRRPGRRPPTGRWLGTVAMVAALASLAALATMAVAMAGLVRLDAADLIRYPTDDAHTLRAGAWLLAALAPVMLLSLRPVWVRSGWGLWRRLHFSLFALSLSALAILLWQWRVIGAPLL